MKGRLNKNSWLLNVPIAHRGLYDDNNPENTLPAFERAIENNYAIETDVQMSKDGVLFCYHDNNALRVCGVDKDVREMTIDEIKKLRPLNKNYEVLTFEEFLNIVNGRTPLLIEIKDQNKRKGIEKKVVDLLKRYKGEFAVQSFNPFIVRRIQKLAPEFLRGVLTTRVNSVNAPRIVMRFMTKFHFKYIVKCDFFNENLDDLLVNKKYSENYYVLTYTVKTPNDVQTAELFADNVVFEQTANKLDKFKNN